ncbi:zinc finger protein CONSTANS-LIKE 13-like [Bidens hawaiensis]|uniref:zinc finger protein CONSTANS-LIKE 13-like n=1 Tax=Bidens hawaiensis TaxID=980011 RepID=UPI00404B8466
MPNSPPPATTHRRDCDFCNQSTAILYCRADNAKLSLSCDRQVHSTNPLFTKHTRSLLCDACDSSPATIFCSTDNVVHCQNCDWETHNKDYSKSHDRRPVEVFTGCPSVNDLLFVFGFEDLEKKGVLINGGGDGGSGSGYGFSDYSVRETPVFVRLDDLIVDSGSDHNYQVMGVPPLPKNRNAAFGTYKAELINQLRELAKSEPNVDDSQDIIKPLTEFLPAQNFQLEGEHKPEENVNMSFEINTFQWCPDNSDTTGQELFCDQLVGNNNTEVNCLVPDGNFHNISIDHQGQSHNNIVKNHGVGVRDINSQERETAITRYKEKKKTRRYDKHIRYESRKVRAESRTRIRGRFAKMDR